MLFFPRGTKIECTRFRQYRLRGILFMGVVSAEAQEREKPERKAVDECPPERAGKEDYEKQDKICAESHRQDACGQSAYRPI